MQLNDILGGLFQLSDSAAAILTLALILAAGFLMTRVTKLARLPHVTGYLLAGILIGPELLGLVPAETVRTLDVVTDIALALIAFSTGKFFKLAKLRSNGPKAIILTLFEALTAAVAVTLTMRWVFHLSWEFCLLLGAIGSATAPASTMMTIRQYHAKGPFVDTILQVTALDDAVALIAFSVCAAVAQAINAGGRFSLRVMGLPLLFNLLSIAMGFAAAFLLRLLIVRRHSQDHRLVVVMTTILSLTGICSIMEVSPLLCCMVLGATYRNISDDKDLFRQVSSFAPPVLLTFFVVSGMKLNLHALASAGIIGVAYFLIRIAGKYAGAFIGSMVCKLPKNIRNYLGMALCPQAGVSIGLAALGQRLLPPDMATLLSTIILSSAVLYELVGPAAAKASLFLSGTIIPEEKGKRGEPVAPSSRTKAIPKEAENPKKEDATEEGSEVPDATEDISYEPPRIQVPRRA
jgi:Kef-type K+ transport system membrane component KefB